MAFHLIFSRGWHSSVHSSCNHRIRAGQNEKRVSGTAGWAAYSFVIWFARLWVSDVPIYTVCRLPVIVGLARPEDIFTRFSSPQSPILPPLLSPLSILEAQFYCPVTWAPSSIVAHKQAKLSPSLTALMTPMILMRCWCDWATGQPGNWAAGQLGKWLTKRKQANADAESQARRNQKRIRHIIGGIETG